MVEILITIIIYIFGVMVALKMIENMCKGEELDYPMVFFVCASSWIVVSFLLIKIAVDRITDIWRKKITEIYSYTEENNPYANGETISVLLVENAKNNKYFEISVSSDMDDGCSIFLTEEQITELMQKIKSSIK